MSMHANYRNKHTHLIAKHGDRAEIPLLYSQIFVVLHITAENDTGLSAGVQEFHKPTTDRKCM